MSEKLKLHTSTIGTQKSRIYKKLNLSNIAQLIELANLHNITTKN
ncbi:MAG: helix-turn-helix transcriptional regulator [Luteibaculaceae bacterium]